MRCDFGPRHLIFQGKEKANPLLHTYYFSFPFARSKHAVYIIFMKKCKCGESRIEMFYDRRPGELQTECKVCHCLRTRVNEYQRKQDPRQRIFEKVRKRCRENGRKFALTLDDIKIPSHCPLLGIPLSRDGFLDNYPSLDRIDSTKGYTPENVIVISYRANTIKSNATLSELLLLTKNLSDILARRTNAE